MDEGLKIVKYINDPVYGGIAVTKMELEIIDTPIFQRLRGLRQLARVNYVFPSAEHSRYVHSLGVLHIMGMMTEHLLKQNMLEEGDVVKMRAAALLHDVGHYPLSHLGESVYSYLQDNYQKAKNVFEVSSNKAKKFLYEMASSHSTSAHHEHLGKYIVQNNEDIKNILTKYGLDPEEVGGIFTGEYGSRNMVYTQLLHSSLDADRLDYLLRDSYQTGVKYGLVDLQYLIRLLMVVEDSSLEQKTNNKVLVCNKKGQHVVEHFLMSRYFHYSQVIHHKTNAAFEGMIRCMYIKLLESGNFIYNSIDEIHNGVNDEAFLKFNDAFLDVSFEEYYRKTEDDEYKKLYEMYRDRRRPKVVLELKDLYDKLPSKEFSDLIDILKTKADKITSIVGDRWGYQIVDVKVEKIYSEHLKTERKEKSEEDFREAIRLYDLENKEISYLAEDKLSVVNKLADFKNEFIRIYVLEEKDKIPDYEAIHRDIRNLLIS